MGDVIERNLKLPAKCYDDFEHDPTPVPPLLVYNANLGPFFYPAAALLDIEECKVEIDSVVGDVLAARPEQFKGRHDARDRKQPEVKYSCAAYGVRHSGPGV